MELPFSFSTVCSLLIRWRFKPKPKGWAFSWVQVPCRFVFCAIWIFEQSQISKPVFVQTGAEIFCHSPQTNSICCVLVSSQIKGAGHVQVLCCTLSLDTKLENCCFKSSHSAQHSDPLSQNGGVWDKR